MSAGCNSTTEGNMIVDNVTTEGPIFTYGDNRYDLSERNDMINDIMGFTPVGCHIIIEGHTGPKHAVYSIFNTETQEFEKDIVGANLIFYNDDIDTVLYSFWSDICAYDGTLLYSCDLEEDEFIRSLSFTEDHNAVEVAISDGEGLRTEMFSLP